MRTAEDRRKHMSHTIGQLLPSAVAVAISPFPIVAVVLMLLTARGRVNGPVFVLGWVAGLVLVGAISLAATSGGGSSKPIEPTTWVSVAVLVLGVLLLLVALKQWRGRPHEGDEVKTPPWMETLDQFSPVKAAGVGVVLSAVNPKNLLLAVVGAATIAQTDLSTSQQIGAYVVFVLLATIGVGVPVLTYFVMGDRSRELLDRLKTWLAWHNAVILTVLFLLIGVKLMGDGISGLVR